MVLNSIEFEKIVRKFFEGSMQNEYLTNLVL